MSRNGFHFLLFLTMYLWYHNSVPICSSILSPSSLINAFVPSGLWHLLTLRSCTLFNKVIPLGVPIYLLYTLNWAKVVFRLVLRRAGNLRLMALCYTTGSTRENPIFQHGRYVPWSFYTQTLAHLYSSRQYTIVEKHTNVHILQSSFMSLLHN